jgi:hypothetical protein
LSCSLAVLQVLPVGQKESVDKFITNYF